MDSMREKANEYLNQAESKMEKFHFNDTAKYRDVAELYVKAHNHFKQGKYCKSTTYF